MFLLFPFQAILPFIPQKDPQLSPAVYELVLNTFLQEDCKARIYDAFVLIIPFMSQFIWVE